MAAFFLQMRSKELMIILFVAVNVSLWQKGYGQSYYDLYSNKEFYKTTTNDIIAVPWSTIPTPAEISSSVDVTISNYASLIGHPESPAPMKVPTIAVIVVLVAVFMVFIVFWLVRLVRKRKRLMIQKEFAMTAEDAQLSSTALGNDPYRRRTSSDSFRIPMPDAPSQSKPLLGPEISVTSPAGSTTTLEMP